MCVSIPMSSHVFLRMRLKLREVKSISRVSGSVSVALSLEGSLWLLICFMYMPTCIDIVFFFSQHLWLVLDKSNLSWQRKHGRRSLTDEHSASILRKLRRANAGSPFTLSLLFSVGPSSPWNGGDTHIQGGSPFWSTLETQLTDTPSSVLEVVPNAVKLTRTNCDRHSPSSCPSYAV